MKKPKQDGLVDVTDTAPAISQNTVEELYTAIMKKPKGNAEDEKKVSPISSL
jgi:hypothetical protein